jgi:hypothetical protein
MSSEKPVPPAPPELNIEIDDATAHGIYSNLAVIHHSETEFVLDFIFQAPQPPKAKVRARILTSPHHMKRLAAALQDNIARYEARFGPIRLPAPGPADARPGFFH